MAQKVAVITGAGGGIGKATAEMLIESYDFKVVGVDVGYGLGFDADIFRHFLNGEDSIKKIDLDVTDEIRVMSFWAALEAAMHSTILLDDPETTVDLLVNSAGISLMQWSEYIDVREFRKVLDVNLVGSLSMASSFFRAFYGDDFEDEQTIHPDQPIRRVVNIGSLGSKQYFRGGAAYVASKAGVEAMTRVLAKEHVKHHFKYFCLQPETLEGESQIAGYIKRRLEETRDKKQARFYGVGEIKSAEEAEGYFYHGVGQTVYDIATIICTISTGVVDPLNGSALECLDGRS